MDTTILRKAGLTESQAKGYLALIEHGSLTPTQLANHTGESRTNGYMICEKLEKLGLATKKEGKKALYAPSHPSALETLAEKRRKVVIRNEHDVQQGISPLIDLFFAATETPGTRTLQGVEGIKKVYADTLRAKSDIYLVRTLADDVDLGVEYFNTYRIQRAKNNITTHALTPTTPAAIERMQSGEDKKLRFMRTLLPHNSYTAPVEIDVYDDKVVLISFGETQMATIITSPFIAEAIRQLLRILMQQLAERPENPEPSAAPAFQDGGEPPVS